MPGNPTCQAKNRVLDIFEKTGLSCLANPFVNPSLASGKVACGYENRVDPNCCGEQWDQDLGLYYNRARYLNTDSGRFWSQDKLEGRKGDPISLHKYLYGNANPLSFEDPSGNSGLMDLMWGVTIATTLGSIATVSISLALGAQGYDSEHPALGVVASLRISGAAQGGVIEGGVDVLWALV